MVKTPVSVIGAVIFNRYSVDTIPDIIEVNGGFHIVGTHSPVHTVSVKINHLCQRPQKHIAAAVIFLPCQING